MQMQLAGIGNLREIESYYYFHKKQVSSFPFLCYPSQSNIQITDSSIITPDRKIFSNTQNVENIMNNPTEQRLCHIQFVMIENVKSVDYQTAFIMGHFLGLEVSLLCKVLFSYKNPWPLFHLNLAVCIFFKNTTKNRNKRKRYPQMRLQKNEPL